MLEIMLTVRREQKDFPIEYCYLLDEQTVYTFPENYLFTNI